MHKLETPFTISNMDEIQKKTEAASLLWNAQEVGMGVVWEVVAREHQLGH